MEPKWASTNKEWKDEMEMDLFSAVITCVIVDATGASKMYALFLPICSSLSFTET